MGLESFSQMYLWTVMKSAGRRGGCSKRPGSHGKVPPTDHGPCARQDECPTVCRPQLPPADDGRDRGAHICQVWQRQTMELLSCSKPHELCLCRRSSSACCYASRRRCIQRRRWTNNEIMPFGFADVQICGFYLWNIEFVVGSVNKDKWNWFAEMKLFYPCWKQCFNSSQA